VKLGDKVIRLAGNGEVVHLWAEQEY
jgi:hypothetical protein